jgi:hypothetical protein
MLFAASFTLPLILATPPFSPQPFLMLFTPRITFVIYVSIFSRQHYADTATTRRF